MADPLKDWTNKYLGGAGIGTSVIHELLTPNTESPSSSVVNVDASEVTPSVESSEPSSASTPVQSNIFSISPTKTQMEADAAENKAQQAETLEVRKPRTLLDAINDFSENTLAPAYGAVGNGVADLATNAVNNYQQSKQLRGEFDKILKDQEFSGFRDPSLLPSEINSYWLNSGRNEYNDARGSLYEAMDKEGERKAQAAAQAAGSLDEALSEPKGVVAIDFLNEDIDESHQKKLDNIIVGYNEDGTPIYKDGWEEAVDTSWISPSNPNAIEMSTKDFSENTLVPAYGSFGKDVADLATNAVNNYQQSKQLRGEFDKILKDQEFSGFRDPSLLPSEINSYWLNSGRNEYNDARGSLYEAMDKEGERKAQAAAQAAGSLDEALSEPKGVVAIDFLNEDIDESHQKKLDNIIVGYNEDGTPIYKDGWEEAVDTSWISPSNPNAIEMSTQQGVAAEDWEDMSVFMNMEKFNKMRGDALKAVLEDVQSLANRAGSINTTNPSATDLYTLQNDPGLIETINSQEARDENNRRADEHAENAAEAKGQFLEDSGVQNVDDGTDDKAHRMANKITGEELNRQIASGQVSQPDSAQIKIDNNAIYYKSDLTRRGMKGLQYNALGALLDDVATMPNSIRNAVYDARENLTSYGVNIDGLQLNSKDIENSDLYDQVARIQEEYQENPKVYLPEADYWYDINNRIVPYRDGALGYLNEDGDCVVTLMDGTELIFSGNENESPTQEAQRIMKYDLEGVMNNTASSNNTWIKEYAIRPVYVGDQELTFDQAYRLLMDMSTMDSGGGGFRSDPGISYQYGAFNMSKPSAAYADDDQWAKLTTDALPYFTDIVTGSMPIMVESALRNAPHPVLRALGYLAPFSNSAAYTAASGLDPSGDRKGSYRKSVDELSDEAREALKAKEIDPDEYQKDRKNKLIPQQVVSNYALSLTEDLWGGVGKSALSAPLKGIANAVAKKSRTARKAGEKLDTSRFWQTLKGGVGEGLEEIPGNIAEEGTKSGLLSWYGDYLRDENGNLISDESGNLLKEQNPSEGVSSRFWEDAPEAFWGGAMLGVPFSFLGSKGAVKANKAKHAANKNKYENAEGKFSANAYDLYNNKVGE